MKTLVLSKPIYLCPRWHPFTRTWDITFYILGGKNYSSDVQNIDYKGLWNVFFTNNFQVVGFVHVHFVPTSILLVKCFQIERIGPQHQAGSDSLLTGAAFFKMREVRSYKFSIFNDHTHSLRSLNITPQSI